MRNRCRPSRAVRSHHFALHAALGMGVVAAGLLVSGTASAQAAPRFPFPSGNTNALSSGSLTSHELRAQYNTWKATFLQNCGDGSIRLQYPENEGNDTRSEGIGYGMVIAAYMGDQATFDGLWNYWERFDNNSLMNWRTFGCTGGSENGSASDADVDAALGLIVADIQWGGYAADATRVISAIRTTEILNCNGRDLLDPGSDGNFGSCGCINPSYFAPAYYGAFAEYDAAGAALWNGAIADAYATLGDVQNDQSGLLPAWSSAAQVAIAGCNFQVAGGGNANEYQSDAARTPWRVATDLAWNNSAAARGFLTPMVNWLKTQNRITHIVDRYALNGNALPQTGNGPQLNNATLNADGRRSTITMGAFSTAAVAGTQADLDSFVGAWQSLYVAGDSTGPNATVQPHAFNSSLALLYGLLATGTMWDPLGSDPVLKPEPARADQPGNQLENGDFDEGLLGWTFVNISDPATPGTPAEGYAMHLEGETHIAVQRTAALPADPWEVRLSQGVSVQANQTYRISINARAATARTLKVSVESGPGQPYALYGALGNRRAVGPVTLGPDMQTYDWVFISAGTNANARFDIDVANSDVTLTIDDVVFESSTLPVSTTGDLAGLPPPVVGEPGAGGSGGGTQPTGVGAPMVGPNGQVIPPSGDTTTGQPISGGVPGASGGLPAPSAGRPTGTGACSVQNDPACGQFQCSVVLKLCYDPNGYVWDATANMGAGAWTQPPSAHCGQGLVFWPILGACYDPASGYYWNPMTNAWVPYGDGYTEGWDTNSDSGCAISGMPARGAAAGWLLAGLIAAGCGLAYRRRR